MLNQKKRKLRMALLVVVHYFRWVSDHRYRYDNIIYTSLFRNSNSEMATTMTMMTTTMMI